MKKILLTLLTVTLLLMGFAVPSYAVERCSCGLSDKPHDPIGHVQYVYTADIESTVTPTKHRGICDTCTDEWHGHSPDCAMVMGKWENHIFEYQGSGADRKKVCSKCGYSIEAPCDHRKTSWVWSSTENCSKTCDACGLILTTSKHNFEPFNYENTKGISQTTIYEEHGMLCSKCGKFDTFDKKHNFVTTYKPYNVPSNPIVDIADVKSAPLYHSISYECKDCGFKYTANTFSNTDTLHVFNNNKCKYCGYKQTILPKPTGLKVGKKGKVTSRTWKVAAHWEWVGNKLYYRKAHKMTGYFFNVGIKWNSVKNAYAYVVSTTKLKSGDYVNKIGNGYSQTFTKKTNYTYSATLPSKTTKKITLYVAPLSKDGYIGKASTIKIKVK